MTGKRKHRRGVEKACRNRTIVMFLTVKVHACLRNSIAGSDDSEKGESLEFDLLAVQPVSAMGRPAPSPST